MNRHLFGQIWLSSKPGSVPSILGQSTCSRSLAAWLWLVTLVLIGSCAQPPSKVPECQCVEAKAQCPESPSDAVTDSEPEVREPDAPVEPESPIPVHADDAKWGQTDALVTIVYASDFQCPFCARVVPTLDKLKEQYGPESLRFVFKHNPLPFHEQAPAVHRAAVVVQRLGGNDAFWKFHHLAFANQEMLNADNFVRWAGAAGVDAAEFRRRFDQSEQQNETSPESQVRRDLEENAAIGIRGTPAFRINGAEVSGAQPLERFQAVIDEQLKGAKQLLDSGVPRALVSATATQANFRQAKKPPSPAVADTDSYQIAVLSSDPQRGLDDALVTLVVWGDFECPFCARVQPTLQQLTHEYGTDLRIVWKDNPLGFHARAKPAATLARAAFEQGGDAAFWMAHDLLYQSQADLSDAALERIARQVGVPWKKVQAAIQTNRYGNLFEDSQALAADFEARGTPYFFINGRRLSGAQPIAAFKELVDEQLALAKGLVESGVARGKVYEQIMAGATPAPKPERRNVAAPTRSNPSRGAQRPKVLIQAFEDFECPFCARAKSTLDEIVKQHPEVQVVYRHMPLPFHAHAMLAAEASHEVFLQQGNRGFWKYHDKLLENQKALTRADLERYAALQGVDMGRLRSALDQGIHRAHVEADMQVAKDAGVKGTPAFTVNGYFISGAHPYPRFKRLIRYALSNP